MREETIEEKELARIRELSLLFGPSGCEGEVADWLEERIRPMGYRTWRDRMGNVIVPIRGGGDPAAPRRRVMVSAHMDEVGVMISEICEDGLLRFDTVGGIHSSVLEGRKMTLGDETRRLCGVVASKAIHHKKQSERNRLTPIGQLYIDIGAESREEAERIVSVGDLGVFDSEFYCFGKENSLIKGKALDDRMGCAALLSVLESLAREPLQAAVDVYACFTVREEIGLSGAKVAAQTVCPDLAIVLESTAVANLFGVPTSKQVANLGDGGVISLMDRSTVYDRELVRLALQTAKENGIAAQVKRYVSGGNDAGSIHKSGIGVRTLALSVPTRYLHSPSCVANISDYRAVRDLTEALVRTVTAETP